MHLRVGRRILTSESIATAKGAAGIGKTTKKHGVDTDGSETEPVLAVGSEYHWEVIERILFIYAKLNPGIGYVQGMNEIIGPLYYVMASNPNTEWREHAEADTYWCFMMLLTDFRDNFVKSLDGSDSGIGGLLSELERMVKKQDAALQTSLEEKGIKPMFYAFRWSTCLLSQEFPLPDLIRLWDSLFSKDDRKRYLPAFLFIAFFIFRTQGVVSRFGYLTFRCFYAVATPKAMHVYKLIVECEERNYTWRVCRLC